MAGTSSGNDTVSLTEGPQFEINNDGAKTWTNLAIDGLGGVDLIDVNESSTKSSYFNFSFSDDGVVSFTSASGGNSRTLQFSNFEKISFWDIDITLGSAGNDSLTGTSFADNIRAFTGNDTIDGGSGNDKMYGGRGDDTFVVNALGDIVTELAGEGTDTIQTAIAYNLTDTDGAGVNGGNVENLTLTGGGAVNGTGNALNNVLTGNGAANILTGGDGNDTLDGGLGVDSFAGGLGKDIFVVDNSTETITENKGEGTDTVKSSASFILPGNVETLALTGAANIDATGNTAKNTITGNKGDNVITGGKGGDIMTGGGGADRFDFNFTADAPVAVQHDKIKDFTIGSDVIDLSGIDADVNTKGNGSFTLLAGLGDAFTGKAGELRFFDSGGGTTMIEGDVTGDGLADFQIELTNGILPLSLTDFLV